MEAFAEEKAGWLRGFLDLPNRIPSHDRYSEQRAGADRSGNVPDGVHCLSDGGVTPVSRRAGLCGWQDRVREPRR